jgi:UDP-glucose 4-epimerase
MELSWEDRWLLRGPKSSAPQHAAVLEGNKSVYLVTGGGGFIGSHLVRALVLAGERVRVLDNGSAGGPNRLRDVFGDVEWLDGDVRDLDVLARACQGIEVVFHLAAVASVPRSVAEPQATHATNLTGTLNVLEAARHSSARRVVFASSAAVYGNLPTSPKDETMPPFPLSPYAAHKLAGEHYCRMWHSLYGLETVALRYFNVFGPGQDPQSGYAGVIPIFIIAALTGRQPIIFGDGEQTRDFIYVGNVVDATLRAATCVASAGRIINIGAGGGISINHLVAELELALETPIHPLYSASQPGDVRESVADTGLLRSLLGYEPAVPFREGLRQTICALAASVPAS